MRRILGALLLLVARVAGVASYRALRLTSHQPPVAAGR